MWKAIFNASLKHHGHILVAAKAANDNGYPMMCFNGQIYIVYLEGNNDLCVKKLDISEKDIEKL